jgi:hypothetical protein
VTWAGCPTVYVLPITTNDKWTIGLHGRCCVHTHRRPSLQVRKEAAELVLGLSASDDGRAALVESRVAENLRRLVGDPAQQVSSAAVKALVNLSAESHFMDQIISSGMAAALVEGLRDAECRHKRYIVMLLCNICQTSEGCLQLMQAQEASGQLLGLNFRRMIQWFVAPPSRVAVSAAATAEHDDFEYAGAILQNVTQLRDARLILLEPERGILPALFPQLQAASVLRRRGVAGALRNCCFELEEKHVRYMLSPGVDVVTALLVPLAGPDRFTADEKHGMHPALYRGGGRKAREQDAVVRRALVESLVLLASTRLAREHMRTAKVYPVIKSFHEWLEGVGPESAASSAAAAAAAAVGAGASPRADDGAGMMVGAPVGGDADDELAPEDEATVNAINSLMEQLVREDEVPNTGVVTGAPGSAPLPARSLEGAMAAAAASGMLPAGSGARAGASGPSVMGPELAAEAERARRQRYRTVPLEQAKERAAAISRGDVVASGAEEAEGESGAEEAEAQLLAGATPVPDWLQADPDLAGTPFERARAEAVARAALAKASEMDQPSARDRGAVSVQHAPELADNAATAGTASVTPAATASAAAGVGAGAAQSGGGLSVVEAAGLGGVD